MLGPFIEWTNEQLFKIRQRNGPLIIHLPWLKTWSNFLIKFLFAFCTIPLDSNTINIYCNNNFFVSLSESEVVSILLVDLQSTLFLNLVENWCFRVDLLDYINWYLLWFCFDITLISLSFIRQCELKLTHVIYGHFTENFNLVSLLACCPEFNLLSLPITECRWNWHDLSFVSPKYHIRSPHFSMGGLQNDVPWEFDELMFSFNF